jgi:hypothetical protein
MKWDNDKNRFAKEAIFEIIRAEMCVDDEKARKISIKSVFDAIDRMFLDILNEGNDE